VVRVVQVLLLVNLSQKDHQKRNLKVLLLHLAAVALDQVLMAKRKEKRKLQQRKKLKMLLQKKENLHKKRKRIKLVQEVDQVHLVLLLQVVMVLVQVHLQAHQALQKKRYVVIENKSIYLVLEDVYKKMILMMKSFSWAVN